MVTGAVVVAGGGATVLTRAGGCGWAVIVEGRSPSRRVPRDVEAPLGGSGATVRVVVVAVVPTFADLPLGVSTPGVVRVVVPCGVMVVVALVVVLCGTLVIGSLTMVIFSARLIRFESAGLAISPRVGWWTMTSLDRTCVVTRASARLTSSERTRNVGTERPAMRSM
jgi:hypothetical protein